MLSPEQSLKFWGGVHKSHINWCAPAELNQKPESFYLIQELCTSPEHCTCKSATSCPAKIKLNSGSVCELCIYLSEISVYLPGKVMMFLHLSCDFCTQAGAVHFPRQTPPSADRPPPPVDGHCSNMIRIATGTPLACVDNMK